MISTTPILSLRFGLPIATEIVVVDGAHLGVLETRPGGDVWFRPAGWPWFCPCRFGLRMNALAELERCARLPSGWRHLDRRHQIPEKLMIAKVEEVNDAVD